MRTVKAWAATAATEPLTPTTIERRDVGPNDVLIEIAYAGVCHSDIHTARSEWGEAPYPLVVGHEIAGTVAEVGSAVTQHAVGDRVGVDLRDDQRHVGVQPPSRGVVHDRDAGVRELRGQRPRRAPAGGEQGDVQATRVGGRGVLDGDLPVPERQHCSRRPGRGEEAHLLGGETPLEQDLSHRDPDLPGRTDDTDPCSGHRTHRPVPP